MTVLIKQKDTKTQIEKKLSSLALVSGKKAKTGFDAFHYLGKIKNLYGNPIAYQKQMRNEWE